MSEMLEITDSDYLENNSEKYKPLAWVEILTEIKEIPGFDNCDMGRVSCGNEVIIHKGEFNVGDEVIYISTDTQLPEDSRWEFLRSSKFRVKCKKMRGAWSDGLVLPLSTIPQQEQFKLSVYDCEGKNGAPWLPLGRGYDVTSLLGVQKIPERSIGGGSGGGAIFGRAKAKFPAHTPRTDEDNLYGLKPNLLLEKHRGRTFWRSKKLHGSSGTFFFNNSSGIHDGYFGVCSRNLEVERDEKSEFWKAAIKYNVESKLDDFVMKQGGFNISVQGEVCGPKLNGNIYNFPEIRFFVHNIYNQDERRHLTAKEMVELCDKLGLEHCPGEVVVLDHTMEQMVELAEQPSVFNLNVPEEGEVWRLWDDRNDYCDIIKGRLSFKIVSREFKNMYKK